MTGDDSRYRTIPWVQVVPQGVPPDIEVWVSITKLDASWRLDNDYIGPGFVNPGNASRRKYDGVREWLSTTNKPMHMPLIGLDEGHVGFTDGRHRFAWLRDHGVKVMKIATECQQADEIRRRFGTRSRLSHVHRRHLSSGL